MCFPTASDRPPVGIPANPDDWSADPVRPQVATLWREDPPTLRIHDARDGRLQHRLTFALLVGRWSDPWGVRTVLRGFDTGRGTLEVEVPGPAGRRILAWDALTWRRLPDRDWPYREVRIPPEGGRLLPAFDPTRPPHQHGGSARYVAVDRRMPERAALRKLGMDATQATILDVKQRHVVRTFTAAGPVTFTATDTALKGEFPWVHEYELVGGGRVGIEHFGPLTLGAAAWRPWLLAGTLAAWLLGWTLCHRRRERSRWYASAIAAAVAFVVGRWLAWMVAVRHPPEPWLPWPWWQETPCPAVACATVATAVVGAITVAAWHARRRPAPLGVLLLAVLTTLAQLAYDLDEPVAEAWHDRPWARKPYGAGQPPEGPIHAALRQAWPIVPRTAPPL